MSQTANYGKKINTPEGKEFFQENSQFKTPEPKGKPSPPRETPDKAWKQTRK